MRKNMREIKRKEGGGAGKEKREGKGKREGKERKGNRRGTGSNYERLGRRMAFGF